MNELRPIKSQFAKVCSTLGIDDATRDEAFGWISALGLAPDDPTTILLGVAGFLKAAGRDIPQGVADLVEAMNALPERVEAAAQRAVGPVARAASEKAAANVSHLADKLAEKVGERVEAKAVEALEVQRRSYVLRANSSVLVALAVVVGVGGAIGYFYGSRNVAAVDAQWRALATRADAQTWFGLANANPDIGASIRGYCSRPVAKPDDPTGYYYADGARVCRVPLFMEPATAPGRSGAVASVWSGLLDFLAGYSQATVLGGGLLLGLLLRRMIKSFVSFKPLQWLLDVEPRPW